MTSKYTRWIQILSILLALLAMGQLMFCATLLFLISVLLSKGGGYVATVCGLIGSLVCLPTAFKIRSFYSKNELKVRHYDMQTYHRCMLYISLGVQTFCALVCVASLTQGDAPEVALTSAITKYQLKFSDKKFVDIVQILFQCCGIYSYQDWAQKTWITETKQQIFCRQEFHDESIKNIELSPTAELNAKFLTAVPYTCCKMETAKPCRNFDLKCSGTKTINTIGCLQQLSNFIVSLLCSELIIYIFSIFVLVMLLKFFNMEERDIYITDTEEYSNIEHNDSAIENQRWGKFENTSGSSDPYMSHEDKKLLDENKRNSKVYQTQEGRQSKNSKDLGAQAQLAPSKQEQLVLNTDKRASLVPTDKRASLVPTDSDTTENKSTPFMVDRQQYTMTETYPEPSQSKSIGRQSSAPKFKHSGGHHPKDPRHKDAHHNKDRPSRVSRVSHAAHDKSEKKNADKRKTLDAPVKRRLSDVVKDKFRRLSSSDKQKEPPRPPDPPSSISTEPDSSARNERPVSVQRKSLHDDHYYDSLRNDFLVDKSVGQGNQTTPLVKSLNTSTFSDDQNFEEIKQNNVITVAYNYENKVHDPSYDSSTSREPSTYNKSKVKESFSQQILKKPSEPHMKAQTFSQQILASPKESKEGLKKLDKNKPKPEEKKKPVEKKDVVERIMERKAKERATIQEEEKLQPPETSSPRRSTLQNIYDFVRRRNGSLEGSPNNSIIEPIIKSPRSSLTKVKSPRSSKEVISTNLKPKRSVSEENFDELLIKLDQELKNKEKQKQSSTKEERKAKHESKTGILKQKKMIKLAVDDEEDKPKARYRKSVIRYNDIKEEPEEKTPSEESKSISSEIELKSTMMDKDGSSKSAVSDESVEASTSKILPKSSIEAGPCIDYKCKQTFKVGPYLFPEIDKINPSKKGSKKVIIEEYKTVEEALQYHPKLGPITSEATQPCDDYKMCKQVSFSESPPCTSDDQSESKKCYKDYPFNFAGINPKPSVDLDSPAIKKFSDACNELTCKKTYPKSCLKKKKRPKKEEVPSWRRTLSFLSESEVSECASKVCTENKPDTTCEDWEECEKVKKAENTCWDDTEDEKLTIFNWTGNNDHIKVAKINQKVKDKPTPASILEQKLTGSLAIFGLGYKQSTGLKIPDLWKSNSKEPEESEPEEEEEQTTCEGNIKIPKRRNICNQKSSAQPCEEEEEEQNICEGNIKITKRRNICKQKSSAQPCEEEEEEQNICEGNIKIPKRRNICSQKSSAQPCEEEEEEQNICEGNIKITKRRNICKQKSSAQPCEEEEEEQNICEGNIKIPKRKQICSKKSTFQPCEDEEEEQTSCQGDIKIPKRRNICSQKRTIQPCEEDDESCDTICDGEVKPKLSVFVLADDCEDDCEDEEPCSSPTKKKDKPYSPFNILGVFENKMFKKSASDDTCTSATKAKFKKSMQICERFEEENPRKYAFQLANDNMEVCEGGTICKKSSAEKKSLIPILKNGKDKPKKTAEDDFEVCEGKICKKTAADNQEEANTSIKEKISKRSAQIIKTVFQLNGDDLEVCEDDKICKKSTAGDQEKVRTFKKKMPKIIKTVYQISEEDSDIEDDKISRISTADDQEEASTSTKKKIPKKSTQIKKTSFQLAEEEPEVCEDDKCKKCGADDQKETSTSTKKKILKQSAPLCEGYRPTKNVKIAEDESEVCEDDKIRKKSAADDQEEFYTQNKKTNKSAPICEGPIRNVSKLFKDESEDDTILGKYDFPSLEQIKSMQNVDKQKEKLRQGEDDLEKASTSTKKKKPKKSIQISEDYEEEKPRTCGFQPVEDDWKIGDDTISKKSAAEASTSAKKKKPKKLEQISEDYEEEKPRTCGFQPTEDDWEVDDIISKKSAAYERQKASTPAKKKKPKKLEQISEDNEEEKPKTCGFQIAEDDWEVCEDKPIKKVVEASQSKDWEIYDEAKVSTKPRKKKKKKQYQEACVGPEEEQPITSSEEDAIAPEQVDTDNIPLIAPWIQSLAEAIPKKLKSKRVGIMAELENSYRLLQEKKTDTQNKTVCRKCLTHPCHTDIEAMLVKDKEGSPAHAFCTNPMVSQFGADRVNRQEPPKPPEPQPLTEVKFAPSLLAGVSGSATEDDDYSDLDVRPKKCCDRPGSCTKSKKCGSLEKCGYNKIIRKKYTPPTGNYYEPEDIPDLRKNQNSCRGCCDQGRIFKVDDDTGHYIHSRDIPKFHKNCSGKRDRIITPSDAVKIKRETFSTQEEAIEYEKKWTLPRFSLKTDAAGFSLGNKNTSGGSTPGACCISATPPKPGPLGRIMSPTQPYKPKHTSIPRLKPNSPNPSPRNQINPLPKNKSPYERKRPSPCCSPRASGSILPTNSLTQSPFPQNPPQTNPPGPTYEDKSSLSQFIHVSPVPTIEMPQPVPVPVPYEVPVPVEVPVPYPVEVPAPVQKLTYSGNYPECPNYSECPPNTYERMYREHQVSSERKEFPSKDSCEFKMNVIPEMYGSESTHRPQNQEFSYSPKPTYNEYYRGDEYSPSPPCSRVGPGYEGHHTSPRTPIVSPRGSILKKESSSHTSNRCVTFNLEHTCKTYCND